VIVMYMGRVVEEASVDALFHDAKHPYTQALLQSIPKLGSRAAGGVERLASIRGTVPDPFAQLRGCPFYPRCNYAIPGVCDVEDPPVIQTGPGHSVRCHLYTDKRSLQLATPPATAPAS
jgi:oligopeptide/dipeptide ABC transporter ATP-binding protein